ncbi:hypothetical protein T492DRAFT_1025380 [Pavlovales sp. CCMP2436]|nr:hypothetical protein T492DRAFT_1025380 [Pavlovales sp. CCMP2436]
MLLYIVFALCCGAVQGAHVSALRGAARSPAAWSAVARRPLRAAAAPLLVRASSNAPEQFDALADAELVARLEAEVQELTGSGLDGLLNPMKLVGLERELVKMRAELGALDPTSAEAAAVLEKIEKKEQTSFYEKRTVMKGWLRSLFRGQAYLSVVVSLLVSYDALPFVGHQDIAVRVLGFWSWWLFTIPSLRSIKPLGPQEKGALNWAFIAVLVVSLVAPVATKDPGLIWWLDAGAVGLCYAYFYTIGAEGALRGESPDDEGEKTGLQRAAKFAMKAIDFGSGVERGQRSEEATVIERKLEETIAARATEDRK